MWVRYSGLGLQLGVTIVGLTLLGATVDGHFGITPWGTLAGFGIGLCGGMYTFVRTAQRAMRVASKSDRRTNDDQSR